MRLKIIFPARAVEPGRAMFMVMPVAPTLLAALTPREVEVKLVDMMYHDEVNYDEDVDLVAITVRTPLATAAYDIADRFRQRGVTVCLGGPHATVFPQEAQKHADVVVVGEAEETWPVLLEDLAHHRLKKFYAAGPFNTQFLGDSVYHIDHVPSLKGLPHLRRDFLPSQRYRMDAIFTTRGCAFGCNFCPVHFLFGPAIRHRPIEEVVAEVDTLKSTYFNVDDSVFGHPREHQYYLDLYTELAKLSKKRQWTGAGGLYAVRHPQGRQILQRAAESGLVSIAAGIESLDVIGHQQSGSWRKLGMKGAENFTIDTIREDIRVIQDCGIEILGFFVVGFDADTVDTYYRVLEFCHQTKIIPVVFTLTPMPGSKVFEEFQAQGRMLPGLTWDQFGSGHILFTHPTMTAEEMREANREVWRRGYHTGQMLRRAFHTFRHRPHPSVFLASFFTQLGMKQSFGRILGGS